MKTCTDSDKPHFQENSKEEALNLEVPYVILLSVIVNYVTTSRPMHGTVGKDKTHSPLAR